MNYRYLTNLQLDEALDSYISFLENNMKQLEQEKVPVFQSCGRITCHAVFAAISSPHYNACAMDGIALLASKIFGVTETTPGILQEHIDYERVDTGDPLPERFDAVVMIEDVIELGGGQVKLLQPAVPWQHIRQIGEDLCASEMIVPSHTRITPALTGALLAGGVLEVEVFCRPVVGIIPTGDEIVSPRENPLKGEIIEFNSSIFSGMLQEWGAVPKVYNIVPDKLEQIRISLARAAEECDVVLLNAGSSAGREDYSEAAVEGMGSVFAHGIAIRPGKPTVLGQVLGKPTFVVPGYPVSGIIVMEKIVKPVLDFMQGIQWEKPHELRAVLGRKLVSSLKYREFVRVKLGRVDERLVATPLNRGAGVVTSFVKADGILEVPMNSEGLEAGTEVRVGLLKGLEEIDSTLVVTGSHDPLIDIVADMMRRSARGAYLASAHVGSMGGIMAIKRREAHAAGIHLLDDSGDYNTGYIRKYLKGERIALIKGVKRIQGFMVQQGNPLNLRGISDLAREGLRYVNRQKGSGTRVLLDYLLQKAGVEAAGIYGYEREEFTHMAVGVLVAAGSADVGLGIYSAAKAFDLDFIPVGEEEYDFIMPEKYLEMSQAQHFLRILKSEEFKESLEGMGGYVLENPGTVTIIE